MSREIPIPVFTDDVDYTKFGVSKKFSEIDKNTIDELKQNLINDKVVDSNNSESAFLSVFEEN